MPHKILILGGTRDARVIADKLVALGWDVTTSLAGVTDNPQLPQGKIRIGGFGGADGLQQYLLSEKFNTLIDATHPYAEIISRNALEALKETGIHHIRFDRPAWTEQPSQTTILVSSAEQAAEHLPAKARVFLTIGRKQVLPFFQRKDISGVVRTIERPEIETPRTWLLIRSKPSSSTEDEIRLMQQHGITHLVTKNSGGDDALAKLKAASVLGLAVVMLMRPEKRGGQVFNKIEELVSACISLQAEKSPAPEG